jgi:hypothetical protein
MAGCECMHDMPMIVEGRICHEDMPVGEAGRTCQWQRQACGAGRILARGQTGMIDSTVQLRQLD